MSESMLPVVFSKAAGALLEHPAGYALIRDQAGTLLLRRGWHKLFFDTRLVAPLPEAAKAWVVAHWQGCQIARPAHVRVAMPVPLDVFARLAVG